MKFFSLNPAVVCVGILIFPAAAAAVPVQEAGNETPGATLTLGQAIAAALAQNPDLKSSSYALRAADARISQAGLRPAIDLGVDVENFAGRGGFSGSSSAEATLSLSGVIELGGKRDARVASATAGLDAVLTERQALELDVLAEVTRRFIEVAERQQLAALATTAVQLAEKTVAATQKRVSAAKAPHVEFDRASIALDRARLDERHVAHLLDAARVQLAAMWGETEPRISGQLFGAVRAELFDLPMPGAFGTLATALEQNPDALRFAAEARLREAEFRRASSERWPDLGISGGVRRFEDSGDDAFVASVSIPLFSGSRARGALAEAEAMRDAVPFERSSALVKARAGLYALHRELIDATYEAGVLGQETLPKMEEALKETEYAYDRGRYSLLEWVDAQREYLAVQRARIESAARAHTLKAEIERITNAPLNPSTP